MNTKPGPIPQAKPLLIGTSNAGASASLQLDALVRQHQTTRRSVQAWFDARLTRRR